MSEPVKDLEAWLQKYADDHGGSELRKQFKISTPDYHAAIRLTSSVHGSADFSRSSYRHYIRIKKTRKLERTALKELKNEIQGT